MEENKAQSTKNLSNADDGIPGMLSVGKMSKGAAKLRDFYSMKPDSPVYQCEFGFFSMDRWMSEGHLDNRTDLAGLFGYDEPGNIDLGQLGWCEAAFCPAFDTEVIEDRGEYEVVRDFAGRHVLYFKGRRNGFMPEYIDHPVKDMKTWNENCKWRLEPNTPDRYLDFAGRMQNAVSAAQKGMVVVQNLIGGYMYLRSLIGPVELLYKFYDDPGLIHDCMETWFKLADFIIAKHQHYVTLDEIFLAEDICYNHGPLISPDMMREFLFA